MQLLSPKVLLHLEALGVLAGAVWLYHDLGYSWLLFALFFLAPDLLMVGYLAGTKAGARAYNLGHTYVVPSGLLVLAYYGGHPALVPFLVIWIAHIGADRALGFGLKYGDAFKVTHLAKV